MLVHASFSQAVALLSDMCRWWVNCSIVPMIMLQGISTLLCTQQAVAQNNNNNNINNKSHLFATIEGFKGSHIGSQHDNAPLF